jgi:hypothetical protein
MSKKDNPGTILQIVLTVLEAIGTFKWLLPTEEGAAIPRTP